MCAAYRKDTQIKKVILDTLDILSYPHQYPETPPPYLNDFLEIHETSGADFSQMSLATLFEACGYFKVPESANNIKPTKGNMVRADIPYQVALYHLRKVIEVNGLRAFNVDEIGQISLGLGRLVVHDDFILGQIDGNAEDLVKAAVLSDDFKSIFNVCSWKVRKRLRTKSQEEEEEGGRELTNCDPSIHEYLRTFQTNIFTSNKEILRALGEHPDWLMKSREEMKIRRGVGTNQMGIMKGPGNMDHRIKLTALVCKVLEDEDEVELCKNVLRAFRKMWDKRDGLEVNLKLFSPEYKKNGRADITTFLVNNILEGLIYTGLDHPEFMKAVDRRVSKQFNKNGNTTPRNFKRMKTSFSTLAERTEAKDELVGEWWKGSD